MSNKEIIVDSAWINYARLAQFSRDETAEIRNWRLRVRNLTIGAAILSSIGGVVKTIAACKITPESSLITKQAADGAQWLVAHYTDQILGTLATIVLAMVAYYGSRILADGKEKNARMARALAENIKSAVYFFVAEAGDYAGKPEAEQINLLTNVQSNVINQSAKLILPTVFKKRDAPMVGLAVNQYVAQRLEDQITYYQGKVTERQTEIKKSDSIVLALGLASVVLGGLTTYLNLSLLIGLIATSVSAYTAYVASSKYKEEMETYNAAGNQLNLLLISFQASTVKDYNKLVIDTEHILQAENSGWMGLWSAK